MVTKRNLVREHTSLALAIALIETGLRAPFVSEITEISEWYVRKLVVDILGHAPPRGQVPHSDVWFLRGRHHQHAALFLSLYAPLRRALSEHQSIADPFVRALLRYRSAVDKSGWPELISADRAWWLLKMLASQQLKVFRCVACGGFFLTSARDRRIARHGALCWMPQAASRAVPLSWASLNHG